MNIIHVVDSMEVGGAETLIALMCRAQKREGHLPSVCCIFDRGRLAEELEAEGIPVFLANGHGNESGILGQLRMARSLYRRFCRERPDVVHCHNILPTLLAAPAARVAGVPAIFSTRHGLAIPYNAACRVKGIADSRGAFYRFRLAAMACDRVIAVCDTARQNLMWGPGAFLNRVITIRNGAARLPVGTTSPSATAPQKFTLIHVARLNWKKNQRGLLEAAAIALPSVPDLMLQIIGDGLERRALEQYARELGIEGRVHFAGERSDVGEWLAKADLFVLSSFTEGLPVSLVEAMAAGLPFLVSNVWGMPEVANLSGGGVIVEGTTPQALAKGIVHLAQKRQELKDLGRRSRECYEKHFTPELMLNSYSRLYDQTVRTRRRRVGPDVRVLHVVLSFARGGRRNAIADLIEGLKERGVKNEICCLDELGCDPSEVMDLGERIGSLERNRLFDWKKLSAFRKLCREECIDIIHTHDA